MTGNEGQDDAEKEARRARAKAYLETDFDGQLDWYDRRATTFKSRAFGLGMVVIACGALVSFFAAIGPWIPDLQPVIAAALGMAIVIAQGALRIWRYDEIWVEYRKASERMKREERLYVNGCGVYAQSPDEEARYRDFVEAIEAVIAEEQQLFFERAARPRQENGSEAA